MRRCLGEGEGWRGREGEREGVGFTKTFRNRQ